jgi:hypothetical protein
MRTYNDLVIDTILVTACCGDYAVRQNGEQVKRPSQLVAGEPLICEGCGDSPELIEEEVAYD